MAGPIPAPSHRPLAPGDVDVLITAEEGFPAFERAVLATRDRIVAGFRIFDFSTKLRTPEAQAVGDDWFDLILDAVNRGVAFTLVVSDFDPVVGTELHGETWRTLRSACALVELARPDARIHVTTSLHPATVGGLARLALWPRVRGLVSQKLRRFARRGDASLARFLTRHPHLSEFIVRVGDHARPRAWPLPHLWPVTHHQKAAVFDGREVYIGGLDLNERRWDTWRHDRDAEQTWHDVQLLVRDPETARAVETHLEEFCDVIDGETPPSDLDGRVLRTLSARPLGANILAPRPVLHEIEEAILGGIAGARQLIYIETQYLRSRRIARALAKAGQARPGLRLAVILPAAPEDVAFNGATRSDARFGEYLQATAIRRLRRAFRGRLFVGCPARPVTAQGGGRSVIHGAPLIYVHAKVFVADDTFAVVGSANLNGRSMRWDTELAIPLTDREVVVGLRRRCLQHLLGDAAETYPEVFEPDTTVPALQRLAVSNARRRPETREGLVVPYLTRPGRRFGRVLRAVPEEMV